MIQGASHNERGALIAFAEARFRESSSYIRFPRGQTLRHALPGLLVLKLIRVTCRP